MIIKLFSLTRNVKTKVNIVPSRSALRRGKPTKTLLDDIPVKAARIGCCRLLKRSEK